jgi:hypothetical protein
VIVTTGGGAAALAYATTTTIPIAFVSGVDPITSGLVMNLNRPGGNATGVYILQQVALNHLVGARAARAKFVDPLDSRPSGWCRPDRGGYARPIWRTTLAGAVSAPRIARGKAQTGLVRCSK